MLPRISLVHQFEQQQSETMDLAFSSDGEQLGSSDGKALYLWRLNEAGNWDYERSFTHKYAAFLRFAPNGKLFAIVCEEGIVKLLSFNGNEGMVKLPRAPYIPWAFSPDLRWFVSNGSEQTLLLWNLDSQQRFSIPLLFQEASRSGNETNPSPKHVGGFLFTPDSRRVVLWAHTTEGELHICSFDPEQRRITLQKTLPQGLMDGAVSPDGKLLAIIVTNEDVPGHTQHAYAQHILVFHLESQQLLHMFPQKGADEEYGSLAFSPDSRRLISCKTDGWVDMFSLDSFECIAQFAAHPGLSSHATEPIGGLAWSKTGFIATGGASNFKKNWTKTDYTIKIWKVEG